MGAFLFGGGWGISLLIFAQHFGKINVMFRKIFGHRSKTTHCVVFSLRSNPIVYPRQNKKALTFVNAFCLAEDGGFEPSCP